MVFYYKMLNTLVFKSSYDGHKMTWWLQIKFRRASYVVTYIFYNLSSKLKDNYFNKKNINKL